MIWILGLDELIPSLCHRIAPESTFTRVVTTQLQHVSWEGFRFYDLIFPLFLFLSGVAMAISLPRRVREDGSGATTRHLLIRCAILFLLGVLYNGGLSRGLEEVRWMGVLQRIALASAAAGLMSMALNVRGMIVAAAAILVGYWALLRYVPVPGVGAGQFAEGMNLANYLDRIWLPGRRYDGDHDPEGLLSTLPAIATAILGILSGRILMAGIQNWKKVLWLVGTGIVLIGLGWAWSPTFPIIKKLWTSSYVLVAAGGSMLLLAAFFGIVEGIGLKRWTSPFVWVGANPIALYLAGGLGFFHAVAVRLVGKPPEEREWIVLLAEFLLMLGTAGWLYRRRIYIRI